ncbi:hypothetical protein BLS_000198 [Venturia inaequalis]|uniref:Cryptic loci regulator 2 N-terminal domain-containing protein n=1 Tax=Venturia inaequalis TaxID=5025 RepID=A0A8H3Z0P8_VENIN|nr:hypothetical protein BLS_000198 [Venturia inaequalis]
MSRPLRIVPINSASDGDDSHKPDAKDYRKLTPPTIYLEKLGALWMNHRQDGKQGFNYTLDQLPDGYTVWERPRPGNPKHVDKWCYGHPSGFKFDSPNRFFPHFLHLMDTGSSAGCSCAGCSKGSKSVKKTTPGKPPGRPSIGGTGTPMSGPAAGRPKGRPWVQGRSDDEGTPDVYRNSIDKLKREGSLDALIKEEMSMDWRVERMNIKTHLEKTSKQPSYLPRLAELVLFVRKLQESEEIRRDGEQYKIWNRDEEEYTGTPKWEAGVVTQLAEEDCSIQDLTIQTPKNNAVNYAGFRVEPLPNPNSDQKTLSKQYTYVWLNQIRPFVFWREHLARTPQQAWSPTIQNALSVMSSVALVEKYRFKGSWPSAKVFNKGIYIGSEFICEGDFVRLLPTNKSADIITDILKVESITLVFTNLDKSSENDYDDGHPYNSTIYLTGAIFTMDKERAFNQQRLTRVLPASFEQYGPWFQRTEINKLSRVPFHPVMGRCYHPDAMQLWLPGSLESSATKSKSAGISSGLAGLREARDMSTKQDVRITHGKTWLWEESRAQALDLHEINGHETAAYDEDRDPKEWRKQIRILDGTAGAAEREELQDRVLVRSSMTNNSMVTSALRVNEDLDSASATEAEQSRDVSRKRGLSDVESSEEEGVHDFVDQMTRNMGLPMDDEQISEGRDDENEDIVNDGQDAVRGRRMEITLD